MPDRENNSSFLTELIHIALIAAFIVLPIRLFVAQPFIVSGASMEPTFSNGDYLIVDELSYRLSDPNRGDVIIFRFPIDPSKYFIKRVIGLPGETVEIIDGEIYVSSATIDRFKLSEPYIEFDSSTNLEISLPEDQYFVMGDNRSASSDSRVWGPLPEKNIIGRAFVRLLPAAHAGILPGDADPPQ